MASYGATLGIALIAGAFCGFFASLMPHPHGIFDDDEHWFDVFYGDYLYQYNPDPDAITADQM